MEEKKKVSEEFLFTVVFCSLAKELSSEDAVLQWQDLQELFILPLCS